MPLSLLPHRKKRALTRAAFASELAKRVKDTRDRGLHPDLEKQILALPLPSSTAVTARQDELDRVGTELWNLSTNLRRDAALYPNTTPAKKDEARYKARTVCLLRVFAFLLLDTAAGHAMKVKEGKRKHCIRLLRVALKTARMCVEYSDLGSASKVLETAAGYQAALSEDYEGEEENEDEKEAATVLRAEYYMLRTTLVSH